MGTEIGQRTCIEDDAGRGSACLKQKCDGLGASTCDVTLCTWKCVDGECVDPPDAGGDGDASAGATDSAADVNAEAPGTDAPTHDAGSAGGGPDGHYCRSQKDCVRPMICHLDETCGPGRAGDRCWPTGSESSETPSVFEHDGGCVSGRPDDPTEIVGRCSTAPMGRAHGWGGLLALLASLGLLRARRRGASTEN
jgi:hypothetical protein